jgi:hypothetical protein
LSKKPATLQVWRRIFVIKRFVRIRYLGHEMQTSGGNCRWMLLTVSGPFDPVSEQRCASFTRSNLGNEQAVFDRFQIVSVDLRAAGAGVGFLLMGACRVSNLAGLRGGRQNQSMTTLKPKHYSKQHP